MFRCVAPRFDCVCDSSDIAHAAILDMVNVVDCVVLVDGYGVQMEAVRCSGTQGHARERRATPVF